MIVAGIGCRKGATAEQILAALHATLMRDRFSESDLAALASGEIKRDEPGLHEAASRLGVPFRVIDDETLHKHAAHTISRSATTEAVVGVPCLAEAAALAAAGADAHLLAPRLVHGPVTCALATAEGGS